MRIIGLTGGIASGKTSVANLLERLGAPVVDADQLAREVVEPGERALAQIAESFGKAVLNADGSLNRAALGEIVFADPEKRRKLESITHPAIKERAEEKLARLKAAGAKTAFYVAPLLIEAGITSRVHEVWVVYLDHETQLARLMARDGLSREAALSRIASQMPMEEKKRLGRVVIDNRGSREDLEAEVLRVWREEIAAGQPPPAEP
ncbi:dephospho-coenzyme A kinase [Citrifermentans bemidjiense Bem]|uniref:Dephospho-CoA kinase n=1 Tax=Citrifermentans bemidjiense (strain ATCC BAA-1014 / DSM 16622 / JCM 12645 / Bem) TaxID=404380 RepID=B5ED99_CITBB|nr:dephospho-CoA kinase [Citrifermentans bemidjiense]ACH37685.1 dephospho-coenzyme A kinase [Citrifermentans bemidjiense Bem]